LQTLAAITIDVAFIVVFFVALSFVRPDLHKERVADPLLEFRDPLSDRHEISVTRQRGDDALKKLMTLSLH
jgi:hypothetical protein